MADSERPVDSSGCPLCGQMAGVLYGTPGPVSCPSCHTGLFAPDVSASERWRLLGQPTMAYFEGMRRRSAARTALAALPAAERVALLREEAKAAGLRVLDEADPLAAVRAYVRGHTSSIDACTECGRGSEECTDSWCEVGCLRAALRGTREDVQTDA